MKERKNKEWNKCGIGKKRRNGSKERIKYHERGRTKKERKMMEEF